MMKVAVSKGVGFLKKPLKGNNFQVRKRGEFDFDHQFAFSTIFLKK